MRKLLGTILLLVGLAVPATAQEPGQPADTLKAEIERLKARLDSLERVLERLTRRGSDTTPVVNELAALRDAARRAAGEGAAGADTTTGQGSRTRNLQILNPEISVTGDVVGSFAAPAGTANEHRAIPREFEFSFQSALDPYTRTKIFVTREEELAIAGTTADGSAAEEEHGGFAIEEGYLYWVGLPGALGLKAGKFRQDIGLYNRWHTHALFEVDRPLAAVAFLGEDGLIQTGVSLAAPTLALGPATQTLAVEVTQATNEALFAGGNDLSVLGRFQSFWDVGGGSYVQLAATGVWGENDEMLLDSRVLGTDLAVRWVPRGRARLRELLVKSEWYVARRELAGVVETGHGGYGQVNYRTGPRWVLGVRADYLDGYGTGPSIVQLVPSVSWWQSEWVRLRLQYNFVKPSGMEASHTALLQVIWAMGPHKHETY